MQPAPTVLDLLLRLVLTGAAAGIIGLDRAERGRAAGLRTTMLVGLAAAVAMLQADLLLPMRGKEQDSFAVLDLMRLPLGILSGMGFIGAAAVFRRDDLVVGVTTAATLWFVSVIGLCFGGGQLALGGIAFCLCVITLSAIKRLEARLKQERRATLGLTVTNGGPGDEELRERLRLGGMSAERWSISYCREDAVRLVSCQVRWHALQSQVAPPPLVKELVGTPGIIEVSWQG
jgi:putative Mg2+ transporter-C (MgtC) family protein